MPFRHIGFGVAVYKGQDGPLETAPDAKQKMMNALKGVDLNRPLIDQAPQIFKEQRLGLYLFFDAITNGEPASQDFSVGVEVQEVVDAALESDKKVCWIALPRSGA